jgi:hypothetical protein
MSTKLLTLVNPKATLERCACRLVRHSLHHAQTSTMIQRGEVGAVGLPCRLSLSLVAGNGRMDRPSEGFHLVHAIDRGSANGLGVARC